MQSSELLSTSDHIPFDDAVRRRAWDWLLALGRRLNVDLQLVDEHATPVLTAPAAQPGAQPAHAPPILASGAPALRAALAAAMRTRTPHAVVVDGVQFVCFGLIVGREAGGALIVARPLGERRDAPEQVRRELELIGLWLSSAVAAHLSSLPVSAEGAERLSVLARLLGDVAATGSDRDLVARLADVLAVWHDVELYGYVDTGAGTFAREVWLPGADQSKVPGIIEASALPDVTEASRLSRADLDALGITAEQDVAMARVDGIEGSHAWILLMISAAPAPDVRRLDAYVTVLRYCAAQAAAASVSRVVLAMVGRLLDEDGPPEEAVRAALEEVRGALRARTVGLVATAATGAPVLRASVPAGTEETPDQEEAAGQVMVVRRTPGEYSMFLAAAQVQGRHITPHERRVVVAAADLLETWTRRLRRRTVAAGERRAGSRSFTDVIERVAEQTLERGAAVTVMVISSLDAVFRPGVTQRWVARARGVLRPTDLVGMLAEGEVALLLSETSAEQGRQVVARLDRVTTNGNGFGRPENLAVGIASRRPGVATTGSIVQEARQHVSRPGSPGW